ncbi:hypothetical protein P7K49_039203 [Saguinus oedipus]|uniref:MAGE domain-containing protein n=1 Tax=Saguinus oedipus TaxID=9490 RepID=A0ABQ9TGU4_SAGOE|nr:hypothetical protein P7K49_039203 [Saguinus oedipus]
MSPHPFPDDGEDPQNPGAIEDSADAEIPTDEEASSMSSSYAYIFPPSPSLSSSPNLGLDEEEEGEEREARGRRRGEVEEGEVVEGEVEEGEEEEEWEKEEEEEWEKEEEEEWEKEEEEEWEKEEEEEWEKEEEEEWEKEEEEEWEKEEEEEWEKEEEEEWEKEEGEELSAGMSSLSASTPSSPPQSPSQGSPQSPPQNPISSSSSVSWSPVSGESSSQKEEDTGTCQGLSDSDSLFTNTLDEKVAEVVQFLLLKCEAKEPVTEAEMLTIVLSYQDYFPIILEKAREFMELLFGLALIEVDPNHLYAFADTVDPTDKGSSDDQSMPKNSLLILILSIIFIKNGCASEEAIWKVLNAIGVYAGREHFVYGEPRELLTKVWVQEHYLEYREVPNTSPPRYDFLWGPRAHSESSKRKVLEFLAKLSNTVPNSFPSWYKDALKDVGERAQAIISTKDDATDKASESLSDIQHPLLF